MEKKKLRKVVLDPKTWWRGNGTLGSCLCRAEDNRKCCLGFDAISRGLTEQQITDVLLPGNIRYLYSDYEQLTAPIGDTLANYCEEHEIPVHPKSSIENVISNINDDTRIPKTRAGDRKRVKLLKPLFERLGVHLVLGGNGGRKKKSTLKKLVLDPKTWYRGEGPGHSCLLMNGSEQKCCLGFDAIARGIKENTIRGERLPQTIRDHYQNFEPFTEIVPQEYIDMLNKDNVLPPRFSKRDVQNTIAAVNDSVTIPLTRAGDRKHVKLLNPLFVKLGVRLVLGSYK